MKFDSCSMLTNDNNMLINKLNIYLGLSLFEIRPEINVSIKTNGMICHYLLDRIEPQIKISNGMSQDNRVS